MTATDVVDAFVIAMLPADALPDGAIVLWAPGTASAPPIWPSASPLSLRPGLTIDPDGRQVHIDGHPVQLTRREFDLLHHLASNPGRVLTRPQLLLSVWDFEKPRYASQRTVDGHVTRLRRKLGPQHASALHTVHGVGCRWMP